MPKTNKHANSPSQMDQKDIITGIFQNAGRDSKKSHALINQYIASNNIWDPLIREIELLAYFANNDNISRFHNVLMWMQKPFSQQMYNELQNSGHIRKGFALVRSSIFAAYMKLCDKAETDIDDDDESLYWLIQTIPSFAAVALVSRSIPDSWQTKLIRDKGLLNAFHVDRNTLRQLEQKDPIMPSEYSSLILGYMAEITDEDTISNLLHIPWSDPQTMRIISQRLNDNNEDPFIMEIANNGHVTPDVGFTLSKNATEKQCYLVLSAMVGNQETGGMYVGKTLFDLASGSYNASDIPRRIVVALQFAVEDHSKFIETLWIHVRNIIVNDFKSLYGIQQFDKCIRSLLTKSPVWTQRILNTCADMKHQITHLSGKFPALFRDILNIGMQNDANFPIILNICKNMGDQIVNFYKMFPQPLHKIFNIGIKNDIGLSVIKQWDDSLWNIFPLSPQHLQILKGENDNGTNEDEDDSLQMADLWDISESSGKGWYKKALIQQSQNQNQHHNLQTAWEVYLSFSRLYERTLDSHIQDWYEDYVAEESVSEAVDLLIANGWTEEEIGARLRERTSEEGIVIMMSRILESVLLADKSFLWDKLHEYTVHHTTQVLYMIQQPINSGNNPYKRLWDTSENFKKEILEMFLEMTPEDATRFAITNIQLINEFVLEAMPLGDEYVAIIRQWPAKMIGSILRSSLEEMNDYISQRDEVGDVDTQSAQITNQLLNMTYSQKAFNPIWQWFTHNSDKSEKVVRCIEVFTDEQSISMLYQRNPRLFNSIIDKSLSSSELFEHVSKWPGEIWSLREQSGIAPDTLTAFNVLTDLLSGSNWGAVTYGLIRDDIGDNDIRQHFDKTPKKVLDLLSSIGNRIIAIYKINPQLINYIVEKSMQDPNLMKELHNLDPSIWSFIPLTPQKRETITPTESKPEDTMGLADLWDIEEASSIGWYEKSKKQRQNFKFHKKSV